MICGSFGYLLGASGPTEWGTVIEPGSMVSNADYTIFVDGTNYKARNGTTGNIEYSSTNASQVINNAISDSSAGAIIEFNGNSFELNSPIIIEREMI